MTRIASDSARPIICGHRGVPGSEPENTIASFQLAQKRGATWVEFDVRPTGDGSLVVHHDPDTADGLHVGSTAFAALDDSIPTFGQVVAAVPKLGLDIEIKTDDTGMELRSYVELVIAEIDQHCPSFDNLIVTSFDDDALAIVRELRPELPTGLLFWDRLPTEAIAAAVAAGHAGIGPWIQLLDQAMVDAAREADLDVFTWTVNEPVDIERADALGVDMIIGDDPATIIENL